MMDSPDDERAWLPPGAEEEEQEDLIDQAERDKLDSPLLDPTVVDVGTPPTLYARVVLFARAVRRGG